MTAESLPPRDTKESHLLQFLAFTPPRRHLGYVRHPANGGAILSNHRERAERARKNFAGVAMRSAVRCATIFVKCLVLWVSSQSGLLAMATGTPAHPPGVGSNADSHEPGPCPGREPARRWSVTAPSIALQHFCLSEAIKHDIRVNGPTPRFSFSGSRR